MGAGNRAGSRSTTCTEERTMPKQVTTERERERQAQEALVHDPIAFNQELWGPIFGELFHALFVGDWPAPLYELRDGAFDLAAAAAARGRPDIARQALDLAHDAANDLGTLQGQVARMEGAALDGLRRELVAILAWMEREAVACAERDASGLARLAALRQQLEQPKEAA